MSLRKVKALLKKDCMDTLKNGNSTLLLLLPLFFTVLYNAMDFGGEKMPAQFILLMGTLMNICLVPVSSLSMMVAEEKEKNTLRTLMLINVSAGEFLVSKLTVVFVMMQAVNVAVFFISGASMALLGRYLLFTSVGAVCVMLLGALIGIVCKNQMGTGMFAAPAAMLLLLPPMLGQMNETIGMIARFTPTQAMMELIFDGVNATSIVVLLAWTAALAGLFAVIYRKKGLGD